MTTPRDAARNIVLAYDMACDAHSKAYRQYLCGDGKQACADKAQQTEEAMHAAREELLTALATPPAPDRTLAELVDAYRKSVIAVIARMDSCHPSQGETPEFIWFKQAVDDEANAKQALLAYQPPAPVSRAGAVEDAALIDRVAEMIDAHVDCVIPTMRDTSSGLAGEIVGVLIDAALAASPPAVVTVTDAMVEAALNEKYDDGSTVNMGGKRHIPLSQMSFSETSRMRRILTAALAAAEETHVNKTVSEEPEQVMPKVNGKRFRCTCGGATVFTRRGNIYTCNSCGEQYEGLAAAEGSA